MWDYGGVGLTLWGPLSVSNRNLGFLIHRVEEHVDSPKQTIFSNLLFDVLNDDQEAVHDKSHPEMKVRK